jgi:Leucine-rich repeat (LRR) protein
MDSDLLTLSGFYKGGEPMSQRKKHSSSRKIGGHFLRGPDLQLVVHCAIQLDLSPTEVLEDLFDDVGAYSDPVIQTKIVDGHFKSLNLEGKLYLPITKDLSKFELIMEEFSCNHCNLTELDISNFPCLKKLSCSHNNISILDLSHSQKLKVLDCSGNSIDQIDVTPAVLLEELYCSNNKLLELYVSRSSQLKRLSCCNNNLTALAIENTSNLTSLDCAGNNLTTLAIENTPNLTSLGCAGNKLTALAIENTPNLSSLDCADNNIRNLNVSATQQLSELRFIPDECSNDFLSSNDFFDLCYLEIKQSQTKLNEVGEYSLYDTEYELVCDISKELDISKEEVLDRMHTPHPDKGNNIIETHISDGTFSSICIHENSNLPIEKFRPSRKIHLDWLTIQNCNLTELDLSLFPNILRLDCSNNKIKKLDLAGAPHLQELICKGNQLIALDLSSSPYRLLSSLACLDCSHNNITNLNLGRSYHLTDVICAYNNLASLDVWTEELHALDCSNNQLTKLDASWDPDNSYGRCSTLKRLDCSNNKIYYLDIRYLINLNHLNHSNNPIIELYK